MKGDDRAIRCFAARSNGVHVVSREEAVRLVQSAASRLPGSPLPDLVWIDIAGPTAAEGQFLREDLQMHPLAVEDCLRGRQRPKLDRYPGYFFLVFYSATLNPDRGRVALNEIHLFIGESVLVTVHDGKVPEIAKVAAAWRADRERLADTGAIAHELLDAITDHYFPVLEHFAERLEEVEESIFTGGDRSAIQRAVELRHEMLLFRRILSPERDVLNSLLRRELHFIRPDLILYFQDVHDHILRVIEEIDAFRELLNGLVEVHSSSLANQLNRTMQTLTAWSIILMSMAVVAGIYGMNFSVMPELHWRWGYYGALATMLGIGLALIVFFRRRSWL